MKKNKKILLKIILLGCIFSMALMGHHTHVQLISHDQPVELCSTRGDPKSTQK